MTREVIIFNENEKYGLKNGDTVIAEPIYDNIQEIGWRLFQTFSNNKYGFFDYHGKMIFECKFDLVKTVGFGNTIAFLENGKWGFIDESGTLRQQPKYDSIEGAYGHLSTDVIIVKTNNKYGFVEDRNDILNEIFPCEFDDQFACSYSTESMDSIYVKRDGYWGLVNVKQEIVIPLIYEEFKQYNEGVGAFCKKNGKWGLIDDKNNVLINFIYDELERKIDKTHYLIKAKINEKWGLIDFQGKPTIPFIYDEIAEIGGSFSNITSAKKDGKWGLIDKLGKEEFPFIYEDRIHHNYNKTKVKKNGKWGFVAYNTNTEIFPCISDNANFHDRFSFDRDIDLFKSDGKWGVLNKNGDIVIPFLYDREFLFNTETGLAWVSINGQSKYIDKLGQTVEVELNKKDLVPITLEPSILTIDTKESISNKHTDSVKVIENTTMTVENQNSEKRSNFLTVLCVIAFISTGLSLLLKLIGLFDTRLIEKGEELMPVAWEIPKLLTLIVLCTEIWAITQMWQLKKKGFYVFAVVLLVYDVISISRFDLLNSNSSPVMFVLIFDILLVILFSMNIKKMN